MNLSKAQTRLSQISNLIAREGADPVIGGKIYVSVIIVVLIYGAETWGWTSSMLKTICGFYHCAYWQLADKRPRRQQKWYLLILSC